MDSNTKLDRSRVWNAVESLFDDFCRRGGSLTRDEFYRVVQRRDLNVFEQQAACLLLEKAGVVLQDAEVRGHAAKRRNRTVSSNVGNEDALHLFLKSIAKLPLLDESDELILGRRILAGRQVLEMLADEERGDLEEYQSRVLIDALNARDQLILCNLKFVMAIAAKFARTTQLELVDLLQDGCVGLIRAAEKFDHEHGNRFCTYAVWWIRQSIIEGIVNCGREIRIPMKTNNDMVKMRRVRNELRREYRGKEPSPLQIAEQLGWEESRVRFLVDADIKLLSLDAHVGSDDADSLQNIIEAPSAMMPDGLVSKNELLATISDSLGSLSDREIEILRLRFGLGDCDSCTLHEIGSRLGLTRERVRQLQNRALSRLRNSRHAASLMSFVEPSTGNVGGFD